jgi:hypothetical protein
MTRPTGWTTTATRRGTSSSRCTQVKPTSIFVLSNEVQSNNLRKQATIGTCKTATSTSPRATPSRLKISSDPLGTYWFQNFSFNYIVNMGLVNVYQLHLFGGDHTHNRKSGLD